MNYNAITVDDAIGIRKEMDNQYLNGCREIPVCVPAIHSDNEGQFVGPALTVADLPMGYRIVALAKLQAKYGDALGIKLEFMRHVYLTMGISYNDAISHPSHIAQYRVCDIPLMFI